MGDLEEIIKKKIHYYTNLLECQYGLRQSLRYTDQGNKLLNPPSKVIKARIKLECCKEILREYKGGKNG